MKKIILIIITIIILIPVIWATWYTYNRQTKIAQAKQCQYELEHPKPPIIMMAPDGRPTILNSIVDPCMNFIVLPSLSDIITGHIVFGGIPERMKVNPYSLMDMLLGRYTVGLNISLPCDQSATTTDCGKLPNNISHYENQYIGISLDYPSDLYADGQNDSFQVTFLAPDDPKRASSASMGALAFYLKEGQTIAEYIEKLKPITLSIKDSTVAGRSVKEITSTPDGYSGSTWIHILVETKKGTLQISFLKDTSRAQIYRSIIDSVRLND